MKIFETDLSKGLNKLLFSILVMVIAILLIFYTIIFKQQVILFYSLFLVAILIFLIVIYKVYKIKIIKKNAEYDIEVERYKALSKANIDAIWDINLTNKKAYYNEQLLHLFGYSNEDVKDNNAWWLSNIYDSDKERVLSKMEYFLISDKTYWQDVYKFKCKNGVYKTVYDRSYIVRSSSGKPLRLIGAMRDITAFKNAEEEKMEKILHQKNEIGKRIIASNETIFKQIKDELHEDVNQLLAASKFYLSVENAQKREKNITESILHIDDAMIKINKISNNLLSSSFNLFGLKGAIEDMAAKAEREHKIKINFDSKKFKPYLTSKEKAILIYRIIENRLFYSFQYVHTFEIFILLENNANKTTLQISFYTSQKIGLILLNDSTISEFEGKVEIYGGKMTTTMPNENRYDIIVVV